MANHQMLNYVSNGFTLFTLFLIWLHEGIEMASRMATYRLGDFLADKC